MSTPDILITQPDFERLQKLLEEHSVDGNPAVVEFLDAELTRARVVPSTEVPANVVTMNSRLRYLNQATGSSRTVTLVYPEEADFQAGRLSVLAPVGCALLGLSVGQSMRWPITSGRTRSFSVEELLYQPEAAGDFHL
jgi:regulator of nucleoside diphosphate kinase